MLSRLFLTRLQVFDFTKVFDSTVLYSWHLIHQSGGQFESVVLQVEHWLYKPRFLSHTLWRVYVLLLDGLLQGSTRHS